MLSKEEQARDPPEEPPVKLGRDAEAVMDPVEEPKESDADADADADAAPPAVVESLLGKKLAVVSEPPEPPVPDDPPPVPDVSMLAMHCRIVKSPPVLLQHWSICVSMP